MMIEIIMKTTRSKLVSKTGMIMSDHEQREIEMVGQVSVMFNVINVVNMTTMQMSAGRSNVTVVIRLVI